MTCCRWLFALLLFAAVPTLLRAEVTEATRREIGELKADLRKAGMLYQDSKFDESGEAVRAVQARTEKLSEGADADLKKLLDPVYSSLKRAHALLELEGVALPVLKMPAEESAPAPATPGTTPGNTPAPAGGVSFAREVAPILVAKCGSCHVQGSKGDFNMANFTALMRGSKAGKVVFAGDDIGSPLVEIIESGDMPRGGSKISQAELTTLKKWIAEGAKFDGGDANANLASLATAGPAPSPNAPAPIAQATGDETVSFARDLAPVLLEACNGCHIGAQRPRGNLNLATFAGMMKGGDSGEIIAAEKPADSLLIQKLKGEAGERMPAGGRPPLSDMVIAKFAKWIEEGARFDGPSASDQLSAVAALAKAAGSTHEQLSADRMASAQKSWALGLPGVNHAEVETDNFFLIGAVGENTLADYGRIAEATLPKVAEILKAPTGQPLVKGRMTLFFFTQRYDYSEFGKMVERRDVPPEWRGHWSFNTVEAYGAMLPPQRDEYAMEPMIGQQIAGVYMASLGKNVPRWMSEGTARVVASRLKADDPRVMAWNERLKGLLGRMSSGDDFLEGRLAPEDSDIASFSFVEFLMNRQNAKRWDSLIDATRGGADFTKSFSEIYGGSPRQVAVQWWRSAAKSAGR